MVGDDDEAEGILTTGTGYYLQSQQCVTDAAVVTILLQDLLIEDEEDLLILNESSE